MSQIPNFVDISPLELRKSIGQLASHRTRFFLSIAAIYVMFAIALLVVVWSVKNNVLLYTGIPLGVIVGLLQYILAQSLHEAWHFHFKGKAGILCRFFISYPLFIPQVAKESHFEHHKFFGDPVKDPDYTTYALFPRSRIDFTVLLLKSISGISAANRFLQLINKAKLHDRGTEAKIGREIPDVFFILLVQSTIVGGFYMLNIASLYVFYWVLPIVTIVKTMTNLRLIAEHGEPDGGVGLRTFMNGDISSKLIGAYGFSEHAEHHLMPGIQYCDLPKIREIIISRQAQLKGKDMITVEYTGESHFKYLKRIYASLL